jgi:hypothetical protein
VSRGKINMPGTPTPTVNTPTPTSTTTTPTTTTPGPATTPTVTDWYAAGEAAAVHAAGTPDFNDGGNSGTPGGIAQNAQQWCADLMFNQQPADLRDYLQSNLPPSSDSHALQEWTAGCESEALAGLGDGSPTSGESAPPTTFCQFNVVWHNSGAYLVIVEGLGPALQSCDDQAAELTSNSQGTFTVSTVATLSAVPPGLCSLDGVTLTSASSTPDVACAGLQQNINWLTTP